MFGKTFAEKQIEQKGRDYDDDMARLRRHYVARIKELEGTLREYLSEYDTPAKDYAYRALLREKLRKLITP